ncbi:hypothetical protein [Embleya sp. NBC_00896]|uniref:hypothetical protein n=1 Tax=Embleya sp. NBC_00896 TaxID=2975961 RepID=UPI003869257B|nr:hypothetical protein OG928_22135 [Embleya sp. NBC_00896]
MTLTPENVAALRGLAADVTALGADGAQRHPAFSASAGLLADRADALSSQAPPFHKVALRRIGDALRAAAESREAGDTIRVATIQRTAAHLADRLVLALDRYATAAPTATPAICTRCNEPYIAQLIPTQRRYLSRIDSPVSGHVFNAAGTTYIVERHVLCPLGDLAETSGLPEHEHLDDLDNA